MNAKRTTKNFMAASCKKIKIKEIKAILKHNEMKKKTVS
jgi:hypothetical protein